MWTLIAPQITQVIDELVIALTRANGTPVYALSEDEREAIADLYVRYDTLKGRPTPELHGQQLSEGLKVAIHAAYMEIQQGRRLHELRERLKLAASRCPFCAIGGVTDLDHHLPRAAFPALSVYSRNLVPACNTCNNKKRAIAEDAPNRQFVHAYLDDIPNERFLATEVVITGAGITFEFRIERTPGMSAELHQRLVFQVGRLELNRRYRAEVNLFWTSQEVSLGDAYGSDSNLLRVREFLVRSAAVMERRFGLNDWRTALLLDCSAVDAFCDGGFRRMFS
jgi:hypothetical protein